MWRPIVSPLFLISILLYIVVHYCRNQGILLPEYMNSYLTDFLCMPIILTFCLLGVRFFKKLPEFQLSVTMIVGMTAFYAVLFEFVLPNSNNQYTVDPIDVVMYTAGAVLYYFIFRKKSVLYYS